MAEVQNTGAAMPTGRPEIAEPANGKKSFLRRRPVALSGTVVLAVLLFFGLRYLVEGFTHESTDDAFLDAHVVSLAPRVAGQVQAVHVKDNQAVAAGELLVEIDPRDSQVALEQKRAAVSAARANTELLKAGLQLSRTQVDSAQATAKQTTAEAAAMQATAERAQSDLKRAQELIANHTISAQEFDTARASAAAAEANLRAAQEKAASDESKVAEARAQVEASQKGLDRAEAQTRQAELDVQAAELNLSYARVVAPEAGRVAKKAVQPGDYVQVGQSLMALVPTDLFVTANFKETQLQKLHTNEPVVVSIDAIRKSFPAHVDSIMPGSGARFSLLPPENAVGNYVKVVQRVPVKLVFDKPVDSNQVLGPGMSVVPSVHVAGFEVSEAVLVILAIVIALVAGSFWWRATSR